MRDRIYYILSISVLLFAITALVLVLGQDRVTISQQQPDNLQAFFRQLQERVNADANFSFRIRVTALGSEAVTVSQAETRLSDVASDYFCLTSAASSRVCYPFSSLLAVAVPN